MDVETSHKPYADKEDLWYYCLAFPEKLQTADGAWDTPQNMSCQLLSYSVFFALPQSQFLFCFCVSFVLLYNPFHFIFIFCILSVHCTFSPLLLFQTTSCSLSHPPLTPFRSPFLSRSPDFVHMRRVYRTAVSHTVGNSQPVFFFVVIWFHNPGAWRSNLDCIYDTCVPNNSCT